MKKKKEYDKDAALEEARFLMENGYYMGELDEEALAKQIYKQRRQEIQNQTPEAIVPKFE